MRKLQRQLGRCAAALIGGWFFFAAVAWAQQPPVEPFDPRQLDEATRKAYYFHLLPYQAEAMANAPGEKQITVSIPVYAAQQGITPEQAKAQMAALLWLEYVAVSVHIILISVNPLGP